MTGDGKTVHSLLPTPVHVYDQIMSPVVLSVMCWLQYQS